MKLSSLLGGELYRNTEKGKIMGVCAGIADFLNVPVTLVRVMTVISLFAGLFFITLLVYFGLGIFLQKKPQEDTHQAASLSTGELLASTEAHLREGEKKLRRMERYVTSETFSTRSRFRNL